MICDSIDIRVNGEGLEMRKYRVSRDIMYRHKVYFATTAFIVQVYYKQTYHTIIATAHGDQHINPVAKLSALLRQNSFPKITPERQ